MRKIINYLQGLFWLALLIALLAGGFMANSYRWGC